MPNPECREDLEDIDGLTVNEDGRVMAEMVKNSKGGSITRTSPMSAKSREKARKKGQKSGKGSELLSRLLGRKGTNSNDED